MPAKREHAPHLLPVADYTFAIARALEWLGDRYLLARPINAARRRSADGQTKRSGVPIQHAPII
jgi:hypothetical protein